MNCVRPGHVYTEVHASGGERNRVDRVKHSIPMGRGGRPDEVTQAILQLASCEASLRRAFISVARLPGVAPVRTESGGTKFSKMAAFRVYPEQ